MTSFSFVKRYNETAFCGLNASAANTFVYIDDYNTTSNVIVPSKGVPWIIDDDSNSCIETLRLEQTLITIG
jgi:glutaredoxin 2